MYGTPRCACARVLRYLCWGGGGGGGGGVVCLSVTTPAPTSLVSALKIRYVGVYLFSLFNVWINVMA